MNDAFINSYFFGNSLFGKHHYNIEGKPDTVSAIINTVSLKDIDQCKEFLNSFFTSLLIHDTTYIKTTDILLLLKFLPFEDILRLVQSGAIKLIDDNGLNMNIQFDKNRNTYIGFLTNSFVETIEPLDPTLFNTSFEYLEFTTNKIEAPSDLKNALLLSVEKHSINFSSEKLIEEMRGEITSNLLNQNLTKKINLESQDISRLTEKQGYELLRINQSSQALLYAARVNASHIICESNSISDYNIKFQTLNKEYPDSTAGIFKNISTSAGVPNFTALILNRSLSIPEFIKIRERKGAQKLRSWLNNNKFNKDELIRDLISESSPNKNFPMKLVRWAFTTAAGLIAPVTGTILSAADSLVLDRFINGWTPRLYLNNELKKHFDKKLTLSNQQKTENLNKKYFPQVGRNEKCPCGSGKKFKVCCGK